MSDLVPLAQAHCTAPPRQRAQAQRGARARTDAGDARLGAGRGRPCPRQDLHVQELLRNHGLRERPGLHGPSRGPPPRPWRALQPLRGALFDPRRRRPERERLHLRGQGRGSCRHDERTMLARIAASTLAPPADAPHRGVPCCWADASKPADRRRRAAGTDPSDGASTRRRRTTRPNWPARTAARCC